ncbi:twin-arginine translocase TatA/TatE family subunit [Hazenella sp. IB182357]|uniref:Sec-independent protein translocase protein TatA n=1 Tax=Polycladospora coralii TaxID=2771432 RepID=A0A926N6T4_9BACL|nr:twin-arginine translocase TatA/TatE family subunit [Polycladospora coralii]MBS7529699.1 twin-arginine translocase TatA/TatE family subunit [Polycladospora coralii]
MGIQPMEWVLIIVVGLLLFGPKKLPELGRSLGKAAREFKEATSGLLKELEEKKSDQMQTKEDRPVELKEKEKTTRPELK